jgi:hypothetical protein
MRPRNRRQWRAAKTVADIGKLTAAWLEGRLPSQPGYEANCGPDEDTRELVPVLAALNRAGYATSSYNPGSSLYSVSATSCGRNAPPSPGSPSLS